MPNELLMALYGTEDITAIIKQKSEGKQNRILATETSAVTLSSEECKALCKAANNFEYKDGYEKRVMQYRITNERVDRDGDIVRAAGVNLENYKKNPIVMFAHKIDQPPVGIAVKIWHDKDTKSIKAWPMFFDNEIDPTGKSDFIFRLVKSGAMPGVSIGFIPTKINRPADAKSREALGLGEWGVEVQACDLLEFSAVSCPANPDALAERAMHEQFTKSIKSGLFVPADLKVLDNMPQFLPKSVLDEFTKELGATTPITKPKPTQGESKEDYMERCIPALVDEGKDQDQAVAACSAMFDEGKAIEPAKTIAVDPIQLTVNINDDRFAKVIEEMTNNIKHIEELLATLSASVEKALTAGPAQSPRKNLYDDVFKPLM